ncbi:MAG: hypothetical protein JKY87_07105 [Mariprofundus sp.]|nr:hypothetical protein [Mariprofundus sp.]
MVNNLDANWDNLRVWQDLNQDGISQAGELSSLDQLGITSINVASTQNSEVLANGNQIADLGTFTYTDGTTGNTGVAGNMADINLAVDTVNTSFVNSITLTAEAAALPGLQGSGMVRDIQQAASMTTVEGGSLLAGPSQYARATTPANNELTLRLAA